MSELYDFDDVDLLDDDDSELFWGEDEDDDLDFIEDDDIELDETFDGEGDFGERRRRRRRRRRPRRIRLRRGGRGRGLFRRRVSKSYVTQSQLKQFSERVSRDLKRNAANDSRLAKQANAAHKRLMSIVMQSRRFTCASSCRRTASRCLSDHSPASAGRSTLGVLPRRPVQSMGTAARVLLRSSTELRRPSLCRVVSHAASHEGSSIGCALRQS